MPDSKPDKLDLFVYSTKDDTGTGKDLLDQGIKPTQVELLPKEEYKSIYKDKYTSEDGEFDEDTFSKDYNKALVTLNDYGVNEQAAKQSEMYFSLDNKHTRDSGFGYKDIELFKPIVSLGGDMSVDKIGVRSKPTKSMSEFAQTNRIYDNVQGKWLLDTPEADEQSGWFDFYQEQFRHGPLVDATWDEKGTHTDAEGNEVEHNIGDYKFDAGGLPYMERLNGRDPALKNQLGLWDTMTDEGSAMNRLFFMENDGVEKDVVGTIARTAFQLAPYILAAKAKGGNWKGKELLGGLASAYTIGQIGATLADSGSELIKQGMGVWQGDEAKNQSFYKTLNTIQGTTRSLNTSIPEESKQSMLTIDNLGRLVTESVFQLKQQTALAGNIGKAASILDGSARAGKMSNFAVKTASGLSAAYMAMTGANEITTEAKRVGLDPRDTGMLYLGMAAGLGAFYTKGVGAYPLKRLKLTEQVGPVYNAVQDAVKGYGFDKLKTQAIKMAPNEKKNFFFKHGNSLINKVSQSLKDSWRSDAAGLKAGMVSEGYEEFLESTINSGAKTAYNLLNSAGITSSPVGKQFDISLGKAAGDALSATVGGALGGAIFKYTHLLENPNLKGEADNITKLIIEGRGTEIINHVNELQDMGALGSTVLSTELDEDGNFLPTPTGVRNAKNKSQGKSQNDVIGDTLKSEVERIHNLVNLERLMTPADVARSHDDLYEGLIQAGSDTLLIDDYTNAIQDSVKLQTELKKLYSKKATEADNAAQTALEKQITETEQKISNYRTTISDIENLKKVPHYLKQGVFNTKRNINEPYDIPTRETIATEGIKREGLSYEGNGTSYEELAVEKQKEVDSIYARYLGNGYYKKDLRDAFKRFSVDRDTFTDKIANNIDDVATRVESNFKDLEKLMGYEEGELVTPVGVGSESAEKVTVNRLLDAAVAMETKDVLDLITHAFDHKQSTGKAMVIPSELKPVLLSKINPNDYQTRDIVREIIMPDSEWTTPDINEYLQQSRATSKEAQYFSKLLSDSLNIFKIDVLASLDEDQRIGVIADGLGKLIEGNEEEMTADENTLNVLAQIFNQKLISIEGSDHSGELTEQFDNINSTVNTMESLEDAYLSVMAEDEYRFIKEQKESMVNGLPINYMDASGELDSRLKSANQRIAQASSTLKWSSDVSPVVNGMIDNMTLDPTLKEKTLPELMKDRWEGKSNSIISELQRASYDVSFLRALNKTNVNNTLYRIKQDPYLDFKTKYDTMGGLVDHINKQDNIGTDLFDGVLALKTSGNISFLDELPAMVKEGKMDTSVEALTNLYNKQNTFESTLYKDLQKLFTEDGTDPEYKKALFEYIDSYFGSTGETNSKNRETKMEFISYLDEVLKLDPKQFYSEVKQYLDEDKAPLHNQLQAIKRGFSYLEDGYSLADEYNGYLREKYAEADDSTKDYYANNWLTEADSISLYFINGGGGAGKSSVVTKTLVKRAIDKQPMKNVRLFAPNANQASTINEYMKDIKGVSNTNDQTKEGLFKFIAPHDASVSKTLNNDSLIANNYAWKADMTLVRSKVPHEDDAKSWDKIHQTLKDTSLIVFDEATHLNPAELAYMDLLTNTYNRLFRQPDEQLSIILAGDKNQLGNIGNEENEGTRRVASISTVHSPKSSYLQTSLRTEWNYLNQSTSQVLAGLEANRKETIPIHGITSRYSLINSNAELDFIGVRKTPLDDSNAAIQAYSDVLNAAKKHDKEVFVISSDPAASVFVDGINSGIGAKITKLTPNEVQSAEADYVILLDNHKGYEGNYGPKRFLQYYNTMLTRAKKGIVISSNRTSSDPISFAESSKGTDPIRQVKLEKYTDELKADFDKLLASLDLEHEKRVSKRKPLEKKNVSENSTSSLEPTYDIEAQPKALQEDAELTKLMFGTTYRQVNAPYLQGLNKRIQWNAELDFEAYSHINLRESENKPDLHNALTLMYGLNDTILNDSAFDKENSLVKKIISKDSSLINPTTAEFFLSIRTTTTNPGNTYVNMTVKGRTYGNKPVTFDIGFLTNPNTIAKTGVKSDTTSLDKAKSISKEKAYGWLQKFVEKYDHSKGGKQQVSTSLSLDEVISFKEDSGTVGNSRLYVYNNEENDFIKNGIPLTPYTVKELFDRNPNVTYSDPYIIKETDNKGRVVILTSHLPLNKDSMASAWQEQKKGVKNYGITPLLINNVGQPLSAFVGNVIDGTGTEVDWDKHYRSNVKKDVKDAVSKLVDVFYNLPVSDVKELLKNSKLKYKNNDLIIEKTLEFLSDALTIDTQLGFKTYMKQLNESLGNSISEELATDPNAALLQEAILDYYFAANSDFKDGIYKNYERADKGSTSEFYKLDPESAEDAMSSYTNARSLDLPGIYLKNYKEGFHPKDGSRIDASIGKPPSKKPTSGDVGFVPEKEVMYRNNKYVIGKDKDGNVIIQKKDGTFITGGPYYNDIIKIEKESGSVDPFTAKKTSIINEMAGLDIDSSIIKYAETDKEIEDSLKNKLLLSEDNKFYGYLNDGKTYKILPLSAIYKQIKKPEDLINLLDNPETQMTSTNKIITLSLRDSTYSIEKNDFTKTTDCNNINIDI